MTGRSDNSQFDFDRGNLAADSFNNDRGGGGGGGGGDGGAALQLAELRSGDKAVYSDQTHHHLIGLDGRPLVVPRLDDDAADRMMAQIAARAAAAAEAEAADAGIGGGGGGGGEAADSAALPSYRSRTSCEPGGGGTAASKGGYDDDNVPRGRLLCFCIPVGGRATARVAPAPPPPTTVAVVGTAANKYAVVDELPRACAGDTPSAGSSTHASGKSLTLDQGAS